MAKKHGGFREKGARAVSRPAIKTGNNGFGRRRSDLSTTGGGAHGMPLSLHSKRQWLPQDGAAHGTTRPSRPARLVPLGLCGLRQCLLHDVGVCQRCTTFVVGGDDFPAMGEHEVRRTVFVAGGYNFPEMGELVLFRVTFVSGVSVFPTMGEHEWRRTASLACGERLPYYGEVYMVPRCLLGRWQHLPMM